MFGLPSRQQKGRLFCLMDLKKIYAQCIEHEPHEPMPDKHTVAQRYLAQALDSVYNVLQDNAIELGAPSTASDVAKIVTTIRKKQKTESGAKATKNDGDTEDEESEVEEESIETTKESADNDWATKLANYMRSVGDGVTSIPSRALQELLLLIWSGQGLDNVQSLAHETRENAATIQSTLALNVVGKERTTSDFSDMASAITRMLQIRTAGVLSQIDSIVVHAVAARVMESYIDEISARSGPLFKAYKEATSVEDHSYGNEGSRNSYRLFVIEKAIPVVYDLPHTGREEYEGAPPRQL
ncbi:hypothetical protein D6D13_06113 [Aureobasidium pullulans]|uniref:Uncharacterized protein n=1 Tax=Aureobasidium pullulans TaxID=5580 RepID=A0A4S9CPY3_AURPU|nr:hypothetical protein D6D13_06113 [Aureobasidium pullulans]